MHHKSNNFCHALRCIPNKAFVDNHMQICKIGQVGIEFLLSIVEFNKLRLLMTITHALDGTLTASMEQRRNVRLIKVNKVY